MERRKSKTKGPKRRKLYVHIGMHKTGTSSIQYALHGAMDTLRGKGFLYPMTGRHPIAYVQHDLLYRSLCAQPGPSGKFDVKNVPKPDELFPKLVAEIEETNCHTVLLSAENLWSLTELEVRMFSSYFDQFDITPIIFTRRTADLVESIYLTITRLGVTDRDGETLGYKFWRPYVGMDIRKFIRRWADIAFDGKVILHSYDNEDQNSVKWFRDLTNLPELDNNLAEPRYNISQSKMSEFLRLLCNRHGVDPLNRDILMRRFDVLRFNNNQLTLIPPDVRSEFDKNYIEQMNSLVESGMVTATDTKKWILENPVKPIYLSGMLAALFVIGAALENDGRLKP